jgi:hypothetical protein
MSQGQNLCTRQGGTEHKGKGGGGERGGGQCSSIDVGGFEQCVEEEGMAGNG